MHKNFIILYKRTVYTFSLFYELMKVAINEITPNRGFVLVIILILAAVTFETSAYQFTTNLFLLAVLAAVVSIVLIGTTMLRPPKWVKSDLKKWDSKYFSDLFVFIIVQLVLGVQVTLTTQKYNHPIFPLFTTSILISIAALLLFKFYVWFRWSRKSE